MAALGAVVLLGIATIGHRIGDFSADATLLLIAAGLALAAFAALLALSAFVAIWRDGRGGFRNAVQGLLIAVLVLAYPGLLAARFLSLPAISDVSTDHIDPPVFAGPDSVAVFQAGTEAAQREAYPDVAKRLYAADPLIVLETVRDVFELNGWEITRLEPPIIPPVVEPDAAIVDIQGVADGAPDIRPEAPAAEPAPAPAPTSGFVEAIARTPLIGFPEDIVARVTPTPDGAIVDMRSASRLFSHDFGSNAARIQSVLADLDARLPTVALP